MMSSSSFAAILASFGPMAAARVAAGLSAHVQNAEDLMRHGHRNGIMTWKVGFLWQWRFH
jgi:hypothetical protein